MVAACAATPKPVNAVDSNVAPAARPTIQRNLVLPI